jgi:hypothetical protein
LKLGPKAGAECNELEDIRTPVRRLASLRKQSDISFIPVPVAVRFDVPTEYPRQTTYLGGSYVVEGAAQEIAH